MRYGKLEMFSRQQILNVSAVLSSFWEVFSKWNNFTIMYLIPLSMPYLKENRRYDSLRYLSLFYGYLSSSAHTVM